MIQVSDYPKEKFSAYWEIINKDLTGGMQSSTVRVMARKGGEVLETFELTGTVDAVNAEVEQWIGEVMDRNRVAQPAEQEG